MNCPCCGQPAPETPDLVLYKLPKVKRLIYDAVHKAGPAGINRERLYAKVYGFPETGKPEPKTVHVHICLMNKHWLKAAGVAIRSDIRGSYSTWRVVKL